MAALTVAEVVERAQALTDVEDPDPTHFVANLEAVVGSMNDEAALTPEGVEANVGMLAAALRNRIEVDRYVADEPGVDASPVARPIFLTGLPRSGTTYFQYLFDQEPDLRMLRTWEGERPVPPPATDADSVRRRHEASVENARRTHAATGGKIDAFHLTDVDGPQECLAILDQTFVNPGLLWTMSVSGYLEYLLHAADLIEAYEFHARVLRLLQWGAPERRWTLKWPCHLLALDAIASVHPDARFVVTHRDPVQALASNCSLTHMLSEGTSPNADPNKIGRDMLELVRQHVDRLVDVRRRPGGGGHLPARARRLLPTRRRAGGGDARACSPPSIWTGRPRSSSGSGRGERPTPRASAARTSTGSTTTASTAPRSPRPSPSYTERFDIPSEDARDR